MAPAIVPQHWIRHWIRGKDVIQITVTLLDPETNEAIATVFQDVGPFDELQDVEEELLTKAYCLASSQIAGQGSLPL
jgi:hypothetical protein